MQLTHKIALCPTSEQADYFARACGTARKVWNWALDGYPWRVRPATAALRQEWFLP